MVVAATTVFSLGTATGYPRLCFTLMEFPCTDTHPCLVHADHSKLLWVANVIMLMLLPSFQAHQAEKSR